jgi:hypothetical protein
MSAGGFVEKRKPKGVPEHGKEGQEFLKLDGTAVY